MVRGEGFNCPRCGSAMFQQHNPYNMKSPGVRRCRSCGYVEGTK